MLCNNCLMDNLFMSVLSFPPAKALMLREYKNGTFAMLPWFAAYWANTIMWQIFFSLLLLFPVYFMVGLKLEFVAFALVFATLCLSSTIGCTLGLAVGATSKDFPDAQQKLMPTVVPMLLFSGWVIPYNNIPIIFQWIYWCSPFQWCFNILRINEFRDVTFTDEGCSDGTAAQHLVPYCTGNAYLWHEDLCWDEVPGACDNTKMLWSFLWLGVTALVVFLPTYYIVAWKARSKTG